MRILNREKAIEKIKSVVKTGDNDVLQRLYLNPQVGKFIEQADIFKMWHGFKPVEELSTEALSALVDYLNLAVDVYEVTDYSYLIDEYLDTIENPNTKYVVKTQLCNVVNRAQSLYQKDVPELTIDEATVIADHMMASMSPATIKRCLLSAAAFCKWCITTGKYPGAKNSFYRLPMPTLEVWVEKNLIKDEWYLLRIMNQSKAYKSQATYVLASLAWMGFSRQSVLEMKNEDVDLGSNTVMGVIIPEQLRPFFEAYLNPDDTEPVAGIAGKYYQEDLGYFLKKIVHNPSGEKFGTMHLVKALLELGYNYENISLSRLFYDAYHQEMLTKEPFGIKQMSQRLGVSEQVAKVQMKTYEAYKSHFWGGAD